MYGATMHYLPYGFVYHAYRTTRGAFLRIRAAYASAEAALLVRHPGGRRILVLPPEQATFAAAVIGGGWGVSWRYIWFGIKDRMAVFAPLSLLLAFLLTLCGPRKRLRQGLEQHIAITPLSVLK